MARPSELHPPARNQIDQSRSAPTTNHRAGNARPAENNARPTAHALLRQNATLHGCLGPYRQRQLNVNFCDEERSAHVEGDRT